MPFMMLNPRVCNWFGANESLWNDFDSHNSIFFFFHSFRKNIQMFRCIYVLIYHVCQMIENKQKIQFIIYKEAKVNDSFWFVIICFLVKWRIYLKYWKHANMYHQFFWDTDKRYLFLKSTIWWCALMFVARLYLHIIYYYWFYLL